MNFKVILNKAGLFFFALFLQALWIALFIIYFGKTVTAFSFIFKALSFFVVARVINEDLNVNVKLSIVVPLLCFPLFSGILYLTLKNTRNKLILQKRALAGNEKAKTFIKKGLEDELKNSDEFFAQAKYLLFDGFPAYKEQKSKYFNDTESAYKEMLKDISTAEKYVFMQFYIIKQGKMLKGILDALEERVKKGVTARILYDGFGCLSLSKKVKKDIEKRGIKLVAFNKITPILSIMQNVRNHSKTIIIDGKIAYTGGFNIGDEYINENSKIGYWKDTGVKIEGDGAWRFTLVFLSTFAIASPTDSDFENFVVSSPHKKDGENKNDNEGVVIPYSSSPLDEKRTAKNVYLNIINRSQKYVYVFTPYLILDDEISNAFILAKKRGVDVKIITPGIPDKKTAKRLTTSSYHSLLKNGVVIGEFTAGFVHAKSIVCDDNIAVLGSANFDFRSLYYQFECGCVFYKSKVVKEVKKDFLATLNKCFIVPFVKRKRTLIKDVYLSLLKLFGPLF